MSDLDRLAYLIGAGVITLAFLALAVLGCVIIWAALTATWEVARQLWRHHVTLGRSRAEWQATPGEAWFSAFWRSVQR
jgi:hypothetical protein